MPNVQQTKQAIRALGLSVVRTDGEWCINYRNGKEATAYYTEDNEDALGTARAMIEWQAVYLNDKRLNPH